MNISTANCKLPTANSLFFPSNACPYLMILPLTVDDSCSSLLHKFFCILFFSIAELNNVHSIA